MTARNYLRVGLILGATLVLGSGAVQAQSVGDLVVRGIESRTGCSFNDSQVEVYNLNSWMHYKVRFQGSLKNDPTGPSQCAGVPCTGKIDVDNVLVGPCGSSGACIAPGLGALPPCCENPISNCTNGQAWCTEFEELKVTLTGYSPDGLTWTSANDVVCEYPQNANGDPVCFLNTQCKSDTRPACVFSPQIACE